jgi:ribosomal protein L7Ae-like RNA K-turn-binding protein
LNNKISGLLGLSRKAGRLSCGLDDVRRAAETGISRLIIVAADAAFNASKKAADCAAYYKVPLILSSFTKAEIGEAVGFAEVSAVSVNDKGFAASIKKLNDQQTNGGGLK